MPRLRHYACLLFLGAAATPESYALLTFNDGKDKILVQGTYSFGYDTNIFTQRVAKGAVSQAYSVSLTYNRKAGIIGVSAATSMSHNVFSGVSGQNFYDPNLSLAFTKGTGRTTGSLSLQGTKSDVPDPIANNRAESWLYSSTLDLRYFLNSRYFLTDTAEYSATDYTNKILFSNLQSYNDNLAINYRYDSKLDLNASSNLGYSTTKNIKATSYGLNFGSVGTILSKLSGTTNFGYEISNDSYARNLVGASGKRSDSFSSFRSATSLTWRPKTSFGLTATLDKDFSISSTDVKTNTLQAGLTSDFALFQRFKTSIGGNYTGTVFLGPLSQGRRDRLYQVFVNVGTALTTHIRVNLEYAYMVNYSTLAVGHFTRQLLTLAITATY